MFYESIADTFNKVTLTEYQNCHAVLHFHQSLELIYCTGGKIKITCGAEEYFLTKNQIAFIPSYFPHTEKTIENSSQFTFIIPYQYFKPFIDNKILLNYNKLDDQVVNAKILSVIKQIDSAINNQPNLLLQGYITVILGLITENYKPVDGSATKTELMMKIIEYIHENSKEKISLEGISKHFGYSKFYFSRLFNKTFNCSLNFYINQVRKNKVLSELSGDKKLTDLIFENGFTTLSSYYRTK